MGIIQTQSVYVWIDAAQCVGILDGLYGCGTTLGGTGCAYIVMQEALRTRLHDGMPSAL